MQPVVVVYIQYAHISGSQIDLSSKNLLNFVFFQIIDELIEDVIRKKPDLRVFNYYGEQFVHEKG